MYNLMKHLDLKEVAARINPNRPLSARGRRYIATDPGQADWALCCVVVALKSIWEADQNRKVRIQDIENVNICSGDKVVIPRIPAALKRLAKLKQVAIDFDREGAFVVKGQSWIEN